MVFLVHRVLLSSILIFYFILVNSQNSQVKVTETANINFQIYLGSSSFQFLDDNVAFILDLSKCLHRSKDGGLTWSNITDKLPGATTGNLPAFLYPSTTDKNKIYIRGEGSTCWISNNQGASWESVKPEKSFRNLLWHPFLSDWALSSVNPNPSSPYGPYELYVTLDFGRSWKLVSSNVYDYEWGDAGVRYVSNNTIYIIKAVDDLFDLVQTDDFGSSFYTVQQHCVGLVFRGMAVLAAVYLPTTDEVILKISPDVGSPIKHFYEAQFPFGNDLPNNAYYLLDDSTGAVFIGIDHGVSSSWGNIYLSGSLGYRFIISLQYAAMDARYALYDFLAIRGLPGIYISNTVSDWQDNNVGYLQTFITFDNGATWEKLSAPHFDIDGNPIDCTGSCGLQLHGWSSLLNSFGPVYSTPTSIGIVIGTGNIGSLLSYDETQLNTYISRDGGLTWKELLKGNTIYEIGDGGGIVVIAQLNQLTSTLYYTLDEGKTLQSFSFTNNPIQVVNIISGPTLRGTKFVVLGIRSGRSVLIGLDFSAAFDRQCNSGLDYENWSPSNGMGNGTSCLLGRDIVYRRRKQGAECFTGMVDHIVSISPCTCTEEDWECDFGYARANANAPCEISISPPPFYPPPFCPAGTTYNRSNGYQKEAGNGCVGGVDHSPTVVECPSSSGPTFNDMKNNKGWIAAAVLVPLIVIIIVLAIIALRVERIREKIPFISMCSSWKDGYLRMRHGTSILADEEDIDHKGELDDLSTPDSNTFKSEETEKDMSPMDNSSFFNPRE